MKATLPLAFLALTSCATVDPQFLAPAQGYDSNPPRDAIVGMWQKTILGSTMSLLFSSDGTGLQRTYNRDNTFSAETRNATNNKNFPVTWTYDGGGWWTATYHLGAMNAADAKVRFRMTHPVEPSGKRRLFLVGGFNSQSEDTHAEYFRID